MRKFSLKTDIIQLRRGGGMADAKVSKTFGPKDHEGSTPSLGTNFQIML